MRRMHGLYAGISLLQGQKKRRIMSNRLRIYLTGVGGQGTLTATTLLARVTLDQGLPVVSGEIHGMAQRGGVVESTVLIGVWQSPNICFCEADILLGFEPLETMRALPYLAPHGAVLSATEFVPPPGVNAGRETLPSFETVRNTILAAARKAWFLPIQTLGARAGSTQSGNSALLGALCATGLLPFGPEALKAGILSYLAPKLADVNLRAVNMGIQSVTNA
jgi:indolepyruvate ferredoxin oxidoreductase beta subunit